jgi:putative DNA primase/helicase
MTETYDIRQHLAVLTPSKGSKTKYHCPVCDGDDLDISKDGAYSCFGGNCEPKDIRNAIDKLEGKPDWKPEQFVKPIRTKSQKEYFYPDRDGNNLVRVTRIDDGSGGKKFFQNHWDGGKWLKGNPDEVKKLIPIYRYAEVQQAIERNELIFIVEGEATADTLWELGIPATTTIGGAGKFTKYGDYTTDLEGGKFALAPDRDAVGVKHMGEIAEFLGDRVTGYYLAGTVGLWKTPAGGMDIGDDIRDRQLTKEQILEKVISPNEYQEAIAPKKLEQKEPKNSHFTSSIETGLVKVTADGDKESNESIGNHLAAIACVDNPDKDGAALLLEFKTFRGDIRRWTMLRAYLAGDGSAIAEGLLSRGYNFKRKQKAALLDYIQGLGADVETTYTITDSSGWVNKSFVLPHQTYGDPNLKFRDVDPSPEAITEIKGTLQGWKGGVASRCEGNSRLILGLGTSFASPLLPIVDIESGGFHLVGATSQGKTTILSVAASVTGVKDIPHWRTTTNGLESTATAFNHLCLPLDEIGQADPRDVGNIAYMLANGQGKARMTKNLTNRKLKTWRLMVLSSGEVGLGSYMAQANITQKGGQEVRLPDIPAVPENSIYGCFETIHGADTAVQFVSALDSAVKEHHGTALDAFLTRLVVDAADPTFAGNLSKQVHLIAAKLSEGTIDSAIGRVAKRFALVQVSLGLAHKYDLLPFDVEQIDWAIAECFRAWLKVRGGDGSIEVKQAIDRIQHLLVTNEFSDRVFSLPSNDARPVRNLLAYRKVDSEGQTEEFWVPTTVFDKEFCGGVNKTELVKELQRLGWLLPPRPDGKSIRIRKLKGKANYYYVFGKRENGGDTGDTAISSPLSVTVPMVSPSITHPKTESDTGDTYKNIQDVGITSITGVSRASDTSITDHNCLGVTVSDAVSPVSPVSPPKTQLGNSTSVKSPKVGDRVEYIGANKMLHNQYAGILEVYEIRGDSYTCLKPDGSGLTSWIDLADLQFVEVAA